MAEQGNTPHLVKINEDNWVQPAHVTRVENKAGHVSVTLVDGSRLSVTHHSGALLYRDAEAIVSALDLAIGRANGEHS